MLEDALALAAKKGNCDIFVVGAANVGKSSMLNKLTGRDGGQVGTFLSYPGNFSEGAP